MSRWGCYKMQPTPILSAISPKFNVIVPAVKVQESWDWLVANISDRPIPKIKDAFVFDHKTLAGALSVFLHSDKSHVEAVACLYSASQFCGDPNEMIAIANNKAQDIGVFTPKLETSIHKLINNPSSFPNALSEHIAFWIQLATLVRTRIFSSFAITLPNTLPTDPGPDGLSLAFDSKDEMVVEIRSVKSSIDRPTSLISTPSFRKGIDANPEKQLEELYLVATAGYGFIKLDKLLSGAFASLGKPNNKFIRAGLLRSTNKFNAVVVANSRFSSDKLFNGYERVPRFPKDKIATYIGSDEWRLFSENVRAFVVETVKTAGVY